MRSPQLNSVKNSLLQKNAWADQPVLIRGDGEGRFQAVIDVMDLCRELQIKRFSLAFQPVERRERHECAQTTDSKLSQEQPLNGDDLVALILVITMVTSLAHLLTMLVTRWGDRHIALKSLAASILIHGVCFSWTGGF